MKDLEVGIFQSAEELKLKFGYRILKLNFIINMVVVGNGSPWLQMTLGCCWETGFLNPTYHRGHLCGQLVSTLSECMPIQLQESYWLA